MKIKLEKMFSIFKTLPMTHLLCILVGILIFIAPISSAFAKNSKITVMTRNLYLGADIFKVVNAPPDQIPLVVAEVYQDMLDSDFWARAEGIADEIAANKPDVVGLNEVSTFYIQTPSDMLGIGKVPFPVSATTVVIDFYTVLKAALEKRGMYYQAFSNANADVEVPMYTGPVYIPVPPYYMPTFSDVRMLDHDYILVRKGNAATQVSDVNAHYATNYAPVVGGIPIEFSRGYIIVDVNVSGQAYRIACTHPEIRDGDGSIHEFRYDQSEQIGELLGKLDYLAGVNPKPIIMLGDFNSSPDDLDPGVWDDPNDGPKPYVPPYTKATDAGYQDAWLLQTKKHDAGYTDGFDEFVSDPNAKLTSRIDLVFLDLLDLRVDRIKCDVVGNEVSDMVLSTDKTRYLWPSDHAGVVADMQFKVPK